MRLVVPGGRGQLALEVAAQAAARGIEVSAPPKDSLDISDYKAVLDYLRAEKPSLVINCAAFNDVDGAETRWQEASLVNGIGVKNLALACRETGAVLVHFSTDYVFDGESKRPYTIHDMPNPISSYGQSKLLGEEMLRENGERYYLVRTSWVFGKGKHSFPLKLLGWAERNDTIRVVDDQVSSPTYAADLARAVLDLTEKGRPGTYHITNSGHTSRFGWAKHILDLKGWSGRLLPARSEDFDSPAKRPAYSVLDNFPLAQIIGGLLPSWQEATRRFFEEVG